jgi:glutamine---fructose-6-phosphate transaminase (isomerizing)
MSERPDWLLPWFPELRDGPPWVTEEMILAQPGLASLVETLAAPAEGAAAEIRRAAEAREPVLTVGSGTAEHGAMAVAALLDESLRAHGLPAGAVEACESLEAALDPRQGGVVIGVSHGGRTRATVLALEAARSRGAITVLVTADPEAPAAAEADHRLVTPLRDASFCHTVAYVSPILVGGALAAALGRDPLGAPAVEAHLRASLETRGPAKEVARDLHGVRQILAVGSGADAIAARELALKIEEGVRLPSTMRGLETVLHGHLVAVDEGTGLVVLVTDPRNRERRAERAEAVLRASRRLGARTAAIVTEDVAGRFTPELVSAGVIVVPEAGSLSGLLSSLVATALALQLLTLELAHAAGTNPDLIRREEAPWREAAELAEAKIR